MNSLITKPLERGMMFVKNYKMSLIVATLNRKEELELFLKSLEEQLYQNFELIIVDQNNNDLLRDLIETYEKKFIIKHIKITTRGLSQARNIGLKHVEGEIVAFPDDDCLYCEDTLLNVNQFFNKHAQSAISVKVLNTLSNDQVGYFDNEQIPLDMDNIMKKTCSISLFVKREVVESIVGFDEELGVGSGTIYGSGEDTDFAIRVLKESKDFMYVPSVQVKHPYPNISYSNMDYIKVYNYALGEAYLLVKHQFSYLDKVKYLSRTILRLLQSVLVLNFTKSKYYLVVLKGKMKGLKSK